MAKVIPIGGITKLDIPVTQVLEGVKVNCLKEVVIIGWDENDDLYAASSIADGGAVLWLIEQAKLQLLEGE